jgi:hypothetical protein
MEHEETSGLVGVQVRISCKHAEDHNGVLRERLGMFVAANNSKPLAADTLSVFAKLFREEQQKLTTQEESSDVDDNEEEEPVVVAPPKKATQTGTKQPARVARSKGGYQTPF